ncbi:MAG: glycosyltransferase family 39 protein [Ignavibacteriae bacterium]|nr:glycosyltransferase family 39 protein [Ignavibacteriota bacterium]
MTLSPNQHKAIAIILFLSLTVFLRLGSGEIQPNSEAVNALKAKSNLNTGNENINFNNNLNNHHFSSASVMQELVITGCMKIIGVNNFAVRVFSALCSAIALIFFFLISRRYLSYSISVISLFLLSGTLAWNNYSRQGANEIPALAFILSSVYFILKTLESEEKKLIFEYSILFLISIICTFFSNVYGVLIPIGSIIILYFNKEKQYQFKTLLLSAIISMLFSILLTLLVDKNYLLYSLNLVSNILNFNSFSISYIPENINVILISNPFIIFGFLTIIIIFSKRRELFKNLEHGIYLSNFLAVWFIVVFLLFNLFQSINSNLILYLLPPAILLAMRFFDSLNNITNSNRLVWLLVTLLFAFFLWSFIFDLRQQYILLVTKMQFSTYSLTYIILILSSILSAFILPKKFLDKISHVILYYSLNVFPYLMFLKSILFNLAAPNGETLGAARTADILNSANCNSFVYLYHENMPADSLNSQLDWYTNGWLSGMQKGKSYIPVKLPKDYVDYEQLKNTDDVPDLFIVYFVHRDLSIKTGVMKDLISTRSIISRKNNYIIFGRKNSDRSFDKSI